MKNIKSKKQVLAFFIFIIVFTISGCNTQKKFDIEEYKNWADDIDNELIKTKELNGLSVSVKLVPPALIAFRQLDISNPSQLYFDSLENYISHNLYFIMTIEPINKSNNKGDLMYTGLTKFKDFVKRVMEMNFYIKENIELKIKSRNYTPVLSAMDNIYGLKEGRSMIFIFSPKSNANEFINENAFDFVYHDKEFDLGTLHFKFNNINMRNFPRLIIKNK